MKSEIIDNPKNVFNPIKVMFTIESQKELDALILAREDLCDNEIDDDRYDSNTRHYWVKALETLAEGL
tara:strand:+ start:861 stop:1064 length:204 start_codon:yes stop_codon:yes gene_type:complete